jgi:hypothetical protein
VFELNLIALVCRQEIETLQSIGLISAGTESQPFTIPQWINNRIVKQFAPLRDTSYRINTFLFDADQLRIVDIDGTDASLKFDSTLRKCDAVLLFAGPECSGRNGVAEVIDHIIEMQPTVAFVVFALCRDSRGVLEQIAETKVPLFRIPGEGEYLRIADDHRGSLSPHQWHVAEALKEIQQMKLRQPTLGVGALLVSQAEGLFFLARRMWRNGYDKLGTFGGPLREHGTIVDTILEYGERRYDIPREKLTPGPMLACTNRFDADGHYVDIIFLFTTAQRIECSVEGTGWHTIGGMQTYLEQDLLYTPVANAFVRYCALEAYARLGNTLGFTPAVSWIQPHIIEPSSLPTDQLLDIVAKHGNQGTRRETWPLFFEMTTKG